MCGICGILSFGPRSVEETSLRAMMETLVHRGPDAEGLYLSAGGPDLSGRPQPRVGLGHRRLRIIDLAVTADQPLFNEDGRVGVVFNGEIYNFKRLRADLEREGHRFRSRSDTEVLVHLYEEEGPGLVDRLTGMFAFAIWDARCGTLLLARDRLGEKPLYYHWDGGSHFVFASEAKAILASGLVSREPDLEAIDAYLSHGYVPYPRTGFRGIRKLPPASRILVSAAGVEEKCYWRIRPPEKNATPLGSFEAVVDGLETRIEEAVAARLVGDVPLGAFLSGGLDSSVIVAMMARRSPSRVRTFSAGFRDESYNELSQAREVARVLGTEHHEFLVDYGDLEELIGRLAWHHDEPFADSSSIPTFLVSRLARSQVTVSLSGDGGDEVFAGYNRYVAKNVSELYRRVPAGLRRRVVLPLLARLRDPSGYYGASRLAKLKLFAGFVEREERVGFAGSYPPFDTAGKGALYSPEGGLVVRPGQEEAFLRGLAAEAPFRDGVSALQWVDAVSYLSEDILMKVDKMSMAVSLESRAPYLDHELVEFVFGLPRSMKLRGLATKRCLRAVADRVLPSWVAKQPKHGFAVPVGAWLRGPLASWAHELLLGRRDGLAARLFRQDAVRALLDEHRAGTRDHAIPLWTLLALELWSRAHLEDRGPSIP